MWAQPFMEEKSLLPLFTCILLLFLLVTSLVIIHNGWAILDRLMNILVVLCIFSASLLRSLMTILMKQILQARGYQPRACPTLRKMRW